MDTAQALILVIPIVLIQLALIIFSLIDLSRRELVVGGMKWVWVIVILIFGVIGPVVYLAWGRHGEKEREEYDGD